MRLRQKVNKVSSDKLHSITIIGVMLIGVIILLVSASKATGDYEASQELWEITNEQSEIIAELIEQRDSAIYCLSVLDPNKNHTMAEVNRCKNAFHRGYDAPDFSGLTGSGFGN